MRIRHVLPVVLCLQLTGCITKYDGFREVQHPLESVPVGKVPLSYTIVVTKQELDVFDPDNTKVMRKALRQFPVFSSEVEPSEVPPKNNFVRIAIENTMDFPFKGQGGDPGSLLLLLLLFPIAQSTYTYSIQFDLYDNGVASPFGPYQVHQTTAFWYGYLPVVWVNWLTSSKLDAFAGTVQQFLLDAERDGHL